MKIEVRNFGPIKKGQIDLDKRFTVFVGYNNSGKTYMSQLLWGLSSFDFFQHFNGGRYIDIEIATDSTIVITNELISKIIEGYEKYVKFNIIPDLFNVLDNYFQVDHLSVLFKDFSIKKIESSSFSSFSTSDSNLGYYVTKEKGTLRVSIKKSNYVPNSYKSTDTDRHYYHLYNKSISYIDIIKIEIFNVLFNFMFDKHPEDFFLPANRIFYPSYYKYIYSVAKEEKDIIDDKLRRNENIDSIKVLSKRPYTKAMDGLIEKVYDLNKNITISSNYEDLLIGLKEIIGGEIILKSAEGIAPIEFFLKLDNGKELDMYMSSSSANQLATLYLYFKFWAVAENNFLIIDEPEENLHPENQIKLVNLLMKFADRGNKVLITTHSPLITDHVNNYANLTYLNETGVNTEQLITDGNMNMASVKNLKHADYGVYFFNGDSIKEYEVGDYGAYFRDFQIAEDKVKNISNILKENIYNNINSDAEKPL
jgi:predicted ATPase